MSADKPIVRSTSSEPSISRYLHMKGIRLGLPTSGNFELTARCNFDCKMCYVHLKNDVQELVKRELTADQWLSIASDAKDAGMVFLLLTGGEPFIRKDFAEIYRELVRMGLMVSINTNGSLLDQELRELFYEYPPVRFNITLYGGSEETYSRLCGNASFEKVVNNIRLLKQDQHQIRLNVSLTPYNIQDIKRIHEISCQLELQAKATTYMYPPVRVDGSIGSNTGRFNAEDAGRYMAQWYRLRDTPETFLNRAEAFRAMRCADVLDSSCIDTDQEGIRCRAGRCAFWLTWDGRMLPCGTMEAEASLPLEIGFNEAWREVKDRASKIRLPAECTDCAYRYNCGVCAANCKCETGQFDTRPDYLCRMARSVGEHVISLADQRTDKSENVELSDEIKI